MLRTKTNPRAARILLAALIVVGMLFTSMPTVSAADEGTLNIHKLNSEGVDTKETGKNYYENSDGTLFYEYLAGAKYTVYKIGTFAETNTSGTISTAFTPDANLVMMPGKTFGSETLPGDINLTASKTAGLLGTETSATTATGPLEITGLAKDGVYLIVESTLPSGVSAGADFIITIPMYDVDTSTWEYDLDAYPKNTASDGAIAKTMTHIGGAAVTPEENVAYGNVGDTVTYSVEITVPGDYTTTDADSANNYSKFDIIDSSSPYLEFQYGTDPEDGITITGSSSGAFTSVTDYTAVYTPGTGGSDNVLTIKFTTSGLDKITAGEKLTVTYDAEILAGAATSTKAIVNNAEIDFTKGTGGGTITPPPIEPPPTVKIYGYGVKKMNDDSPSAPLANASFKLATKDGNAYKYLKFNSATAEWEDVAEAAADVFTTSTSGAGIDSEAILQFKNLAPGETYYLIETAAPTDYIKLLNPVVIEATEDSTDDIYNTYNANGTYAADKGYTVKITNVHKNNGGIIGGGGLPTTGGNGIYLYLLIGAVLMGSTIVFNIRRNRKKE